MKMILLHKDASEFCGVAIDSYTVDIVQFYISV
jgi:hypothetical protein